MMFLKQRRVLTTKLNISKKVRVILRLIVFFFFVTTDLVSKQSTFTAV